MLSPRLAMVAVTSLRSPGRSGATTVTSAVPPPSTTTHSTLALCEPSLSLQARKRVHSPLSLPPAAAQRRVGREWGAHARGALAQPVEPHKARNARGTGRQAGSCNAKPMAASSSVHIRVSLCSISVREVPCDLQQQRLAPSHSSSSLTLHVPYGRASIPSGGVTCTVCLPTSLQSVDRQVPPLST